MAPRFIAQQLAHPSGLLGRLLARSMNRRNAAMNFFAAQQLDVKPSDRVLEIGFGGGAALEYLISKAGLVVGVDRSPTMVRRAKSRYSHAVATGRVLFHEGRLEGLPLENWSFEKVLTVNTIYFWNSLEVGFREIHRMLSVGGNAAVGFLPKEKMDRMAFPKDIFTSRSPEEVTLVMERVGFRNIRLLKPEIKTPWSIIIGTRTAWR